MTYEPSPSLILGVVSIVDIREEVMNIIELIFQILKMSIVVCVMCILWHVQVLKLV